MISRNALYDFVEALIASAAVDSPLYDAESFRRLRTSVDQARKVVRVDCVVGEFTLANEPKDTEVNVEGTIQCWVMPTDTSETELDNATDASFDMAQAIYNAIAPNSTLNEAVCFIRFGQFETGNGSMGGSLRGVTYLDVMINPANEG
jgi:hypothetical protein